MALQYADMLPGLVNVCQPQSSVSPATSMHEFDIVNVSLICKGIALYCFFFKIQIYTYKPAKYHTWGMQRSSKYHRRLGCNHAEHVLDAVSHYGMWQNMHTGHSHVTDCADTQCKYVNMKVLGVTRLTYSLFTAYRQCSAFRPKVTNFSSFKILKHFKILFICLEKFYKSDIICL